MRSRRTRGSRTSPLCMKSQRPCRKGCAFVSWTAVPEDARMCAKRAATRCASRARAGCGRSRRAGCSYMPGTPPSSEYQPTPKPSPFVVSAPSRECRLWSISECCRRRMRASIRVQVTVEGQPMAHGILPSVGTRLPRRGGELDEVNCLSVPSARARRRESLLNSFETSTTPSFVGKVQRVPREYTKRLTQPFFQYTTCVFMLSLQIPNHYGKLIWYFWTSMISKTIYKTSRTNITWMFFIAHNQGPTHFHQRRSVLETEISIFWPVLML